MTKTSSSSNLPPLESTEIFSDKEEEEYMPVLTSCQCFLNNSGLDKEEDEDAESDINHYFKKLELLLSHIQDDSKQLYTPALNVLVLSLCESGYTFTFLPTSHVFPSDVEKNLRQIGIGACSTVQKIASGFSKELKVKKTFNLTKIVWLPIEKKLRIPKIIDDYNHYMNSVDIADQLRSYYNMQQMEQKDFSLELI
ncbi:12708_t:CDS:2 [Cetraspora pellucida]|uniref:12708_t:CDS:1 n=1 Tax=Cetraspora pellucida TaxID=1433469 RepID=A0A9N9A471_9GLOM|nr:12708_t:CDS:2 [Cetraspora pellucida]